MFHSQSAYSVWRPAGAHCFLIAAIAASMLASGCASDTSGPIVPAGMGCVDDSAACIAARGNALNHLMNDRSRSWIRQPATPAAYASGVRLFAMKSRKRELTCDELALGRREASAGPAVLRGTGGRGLTPAQISRGAMLAEEVSRELGREMKRRRCRA